MGRSGTSRGSAASRAGPRTLVGCARRGGWRPSPGRRRRGSRTAPSRPAPARQRTARTPRPARHSETPPARTINVDQPKPDLTEGRGLAPISVPILLDPHDRPGPCSGLASAAQEVTDAPAGTAGPRRRSGRSVVPHAAPPSGRCRKGPRSNRPITRGLGFTSSRCVRRIRRAGKVPGVRSCSGLSQKVHENTFSEKPLCGA